MDKRRPYMKFFVLSACLLALAALSSCSSARRGVKNAPSYSKQRTRQPRWNATTSQTATYYIKKKSPRKRYNP